MKIYVTDTKGDIKVKNCYNLDNLVRIVKSRKEVTDKRITWTRIVNPSPIAVYALLKHIMLNTHCLQSKQEIHDCDYIYIHRTKSWFEIGWDSWCPLNCDSWAQDIEHTKYFHKTGYATHSVDYMVVYAYERGWTAEHEAAYLSKEVDAENEAKMDAQIGQSMPKNGEIDFEWDHFTTILNEKDAFIMTGNTTWPKDLKQPSCRVKYAHKAKYDWQTKTITHTNECYK